MQKENSRKNYEHLIGGQLLSFFCDKWTCINYEGKMMKMHILIFNGTVLGHVWQHYRICLVIGWESNDDIVEHS